MNTETETPEQTEPAKSGGFPLGETCEYCGAVKGAGHVLGCPLYEAPTDQQNEEPAPENEAEGGKAFIMHGPSDMDPNEAPEGAQPVSQVRHLKIDDDHVLNVLVWRAADTTVLYQYCVTAPGIGGLEVWGETEQAALDSAREQIIAHYAMKAEAAGEIETTFDGTTGGPITETPTEEPDDESWYEVGKIVDVDGQPARVVLEDIPEDERGEGPAQQSRRWRKQPLIEVDLSELARTLSLKDQQIETQEEVLSRAKAGLKALEVEREKIVREISRRGNSLVNLRLGFGEYDAR